MVHLRVAEPSGGHTTLDWYCDKEEKPMALPHLNSGAVIDLHPLGAALADTPSTALVRTDDFELMRLVLTKGRTVPEHHVAGEITMQCLEGAVEVRAHGATHLLRPGQMMYLQGDEPHALHAIEDSSMLVTMLRKNEEQIRSSH
jgi:quercetin dioxygenase-like cupin family protein